MAIIRSFGALQRYGEETPAAPTAPSWSAYDRMSAASCAQFYRTQPNIRTVVDFLARNIAQLAPLVYRRVSDLDRVRLANHELVTWLSRPNPATVRYRLIETLMQDLGIYFNAYWLKVRLEDRIGLVRLSPEVILPDGWLLPQVYFWLQDNGTVVSLAPTDIMHFNGYDPCDPLVGLSPIETLRQLLMEDLAATQYRKSFWSNAARLEGVVQRPREAPKWNDEQKRMFREQWQTRYSGQPGQVAVLEDGMTYQTITSNARDAELTPARKLTREECAAAYHVPLPMVGILDHATFSNIREQHKQLYQDCLGPWLEWIQQELEAQLLPECDDTDDVYVEFNISEKLKGSFEEQAASMQSLVGRPVMTPNEARARLNLPSMKNDPTADQIAQPLNMTTTGGTPATVPPAATAQVIQAHWSRQRLRLERVPPEDRAAAFEVSRWDRELSQDLEPVYRAVGCNELQAAQQAAALAAQVNADTLQLLVAGEEAFSSAREAALYVDASLQPTA